MLRGLWLFLGILLLNITLGIQTHSGSSLACRSGSHSGSRKKDISRHHIQRCAMYFIITVFADYAM